MVTKTLFAALVAAIFALACGQGSTDVTGKVDVVGTNPEIKTASLAIEITGKTADTPNPRRLGPPVDSLVVNLYKDDDSGDKVEVSWKNGLAHATVGIGSYTCEVIADGFNRETSTITVTKEDLGTTLEVLISLNATGPTKPEPVELGTYKHSVFAYDVETQEVGLLQDDTQTADWVYTPGSEGELGTYATVGNGGWACRELEGDKINCDFKTEWSETTVAGTITPDKKMIELTEVWSNTDGGFGSAFHRYTRQ